MRLPGKKSLAAVAIGVFLGGGQLIGFHYWLGTLIEHQGLEDVGISAERTIGIIDERLNRAVGSLDDLALRGIDSCAPEHLAVLRQAAFASSPVKELAVIDPAGRTVCTNFGMPPGERTVLNSDAMVDPGGISVEVVRLGEPPTSVLRVRRTLADGGGLAALVPIDLLLPVTASHGGPFSVRVRLATRDGTVFAEVGPAAADGGEQGAWVANRTSSRFGIAATAGLPRNRSDQRLDDLSAVGTVASAVVAIGILLLAWLMSRRSDNHPYADVESALAADQFIAYYQPVVDIASARILGAEVLVRWRKPDGSVISPAAFIPLLEQGGLIRDMTRKLMRRVVAEVGPAFAARPHLAISFNLTAAHFADDEVVGDIRAIFEGSAIRLSQVILELTERQPLDNLTSTRRVIAALQGLGCRIALDDVGTGHSGLSSILRLGVDIIKIDKLFVDSIGTERNSATIIETLVDLARNMRMRVVAEGVENFEQVADLRARGIRAAQGYVFAPPLPGSSFLTLLASVDPLPLGPAGDHGRRDVAGLQRAG